MKYFIYKADVYVISSAYISSVRLKLMAFIQNG